MAPEKEDQAASFRSGVVALVGKPNVGKSTLINHLVGQKVSIVSNKPQTTRRKVLGIANGKGFQIAFIDTPGIHEPHTRLGRSMVDQARMALADVDLLLFVTDISKPPNEEDKEIARLLKPFARAGAGAASTDKLPLILCLNKMDLLHAEDVTDHVEAFTKLFGTEEYMLTSATKGLNIDKLLPMILRYIPEGEARYDPDEYTNQSARFMVAEFVREKILQATRQEVPHATAVLVEDWEQENDLVRIRATIFVEKASQRAILIGKQGEFLKRVGTLARKEVEEMLGTRVYLELYVKVQREWRMDPRVLRELEYSD